jgi:hypothetical protein
VGGVTVTDAMDDGLTLSRGLPQAPAIANRATDSSARATRDVMGRRSASGLVCLWVQWRG